MNFNNFNNFIHEVKARANIREIVEYYGYTPNRAHKICCPFHGEKTPSLHIYDKTNTFHCFGCGIGGDSVTFTAKLFNISAYQAALKINTDFGLNIRPPTKTTGENPVSEPKERPLTEHEKKLQTDEWALQQHDILLDYYRLLKEYSQETPKGNEINWKFSAFLDDFGTVEFLLESLIDKHKRRSMYENWQPTIKRMIKNFTENIKREVKTNAKQSNT